MESMKNANAEFRISEGALRCLLKLDHYKTSLIDANVLKRAAYSLAQRTADEPDLGDLPSDFFTDEQLIAPCDSRLPDLAGMLGDELNLYLNIEPETELETPETASTASTHDEIVNDVKMTATETYPPANDVMVLDQTILRPGVDAGNVTSGANFGEGRIIKLIAHNNAPIQLNQPANKYISFIPLANAIKIQYVNANGLMTDNAADASSMVTNNVSLQSLLHTSPILTIDAPGKMTGSHGVKPPFPEVPAVMNAMPVTTIKYGKDETSDRVTTNNMTKVINPPSTINLKSNRTKTKPKMVSTKPNAMTKPTEDEKTLLNVQKILDRYTEQVTNDPDLKTKAAPRRRSNPMTSDAKRKKVAHKRTEPMIASPSANVEPNASMNGANTYPDVLGQGTGMGSVTGPGTMVVSSTVDVVTDLHILEGVHHDHNYHARMENKPHVDVDEPIDVDVDPIASSCSDSTMPENCVINYNTFVTNTFATDTFATNAFDCANDCVDTRDTYESLQHSRDDSPSNSRDFTVDHGTMTANSHITHVDDSRDTDMKANNVSFRIIDSRVVNGFNSRALNVNCAIDSRVLDSRVIDSRLLDSRVLDSRAMDSNAGSHAIIDAILDAKDSRVLNAIDIESRVNCQEARDNGRVHVSYHDDENDVSPRKRMTIDACHSHECSPSHVNRAHVSTKNCTDNCGLRRSLRIQHKSVS